MSDGPHEPRIQPARQDQAPSDVAGTAAQAREARRERRRVARERQHAAQPKPGRLISTDVTTVSGSRERRIQSEAQSSARVDLWTAKRRILSSIWVDGSVRTEVFELVADEWTLLGAIALSPPSP